MSNQLTGHDLMDLASEYWKSAALNAAVGLGIFGAVAAESKSVAVLADELCASEPHLEALVDALVGMGVLEKADGLYGQPEHLRVYLDPASRDSLLPALAFNADLFRLWGDLERSVREGRPAQQGNPHLQADAEKMKRFVHGMHSRAAVMADDVLDAVELPQQARVLDVGGGPATLSVKLLERYADAHSTVLDLPPIVGAAADLHAGNPITDRLTFLPGDYHQTPFPTDNDTVFYCGALHQEPEAGIDALFADMAAAVKQGGSVYCVDLFVNEDRTLPVPSALFQLNMMLMRPQSRVYSLGRVEELLQNAGLTDVQSQQIPGSLYGVVWGVKP